VSRAVLWTLLLGAIGGFVDAVGFITLYHLFTAHMSGNSVWFGSAFGLGEWRVSLHHLFPIPLFVLGVAVGTIAVDAAHRRGLRAPFVPALLVEAVFLTCFTIFGSAYVVDDAVRPPAAWAFYLLAALPAFAMGVQNAALRQVAGQTLHTTYITGVLQSMAENAVRYLYWLRRCVGRSGLAHAVRTSARQPELRAALAAFALWLAYIIGAIGGGFASHRWGLPALAIPVAVLIALIVIDLVHPRVDGSR
jgi:uncharacterized membrane protein YoaK (UPF0700 family)